MDNLIFEKTNQFNDAVSVLNKSVGSSKKEWEEIYLAVKDSKLKLSNLSTLVKMKLDEQRKKD